MLVREERKQQHARARRACAGSQPAVRVTWMGEIHWDHHRQPHEMMDKHESQDLRRVLGLGLAAAEGNCVDALQGVLQLPAGLAESSVARQRRSKFGAPDAEQ